MIKIAFIGTSHVSGNKIFDNYKRFTPGRKGIWKDLQGVEKLEEADFHIVFNDMYCTSLPEPDKTIWFVREPPHYYNALPHQNILEALKGRVYATQLGNTYLTPNWWIEKDYDELINLKHHDKPKTMSAIMTGKCFLEGQVARIEYLKEFQTQYPDVDIYGSNTILNCKGYVERKYDGLKDYQYSLAMENGRSHNWFSEKLIDCYLSWTVPVYSGCPNLMDFFPKQSFIDTHESTIGEIIEIIKQPPTPEVISCLEYCRELILNKYNFWGTLHNIIHKGKVEW